MVCRRPPISTRLIWWKKRQLRSTWWTTCRRLQSPSKNLSQQELWRTKVRPTVPRSGWWRRRCRKKCRPRLRQQPCSGFPAAATAPKVSRPRRWPPHRALPVVWRRRLDPPRVQCGPRSNARRLPDRPPQSPNPSVSRRRANRTCKNPVVRARHCADWARWSVRLPGSTQASGPAYRCLRSPHQPRGRWQRRCVPMEDHRHRRLRMPPLRWQSLVPNRCPVWAARRCRSVASRAIWG